VRRDASDWPARQADASRLLVALSPFLVLPAACGRSTWRASPRSFVASGWPTCTSA